MTRGIPQPDFLRPVARPGWLAWAWCITGILVLLVSTADAWAAWQARTQALDRLARGPHPAGRVAVPGNPAVAQRATTQAAQDRALRAEASHWQQQLAWPWPAAWAASETAGPDIQWLLVDHGSNGPLRLAGLARDLASAEAAAESLRKQPWADGPAWHRVMLSSVDRAPDGLRFELVARGLGMGATARTAP
jgi:hypothetical protein